MLPSLISLLNWLLFFMVLAAVFLLFWSAMRRRSCGVYIRDIRKRITSYRRDFSTANAEDLWRMSKVLEGDIMILDDLGVADIITDEVVMLHTLITTRYRSLFGIHA